MFMNNRSVHLAAGFAALCSFSAAQTNGPPVINLADAIARARQYSGQIQSVNLSVLLAQQDTFQTRAARLPSANILNQYIYTEGNGTPSGVFVANDGVHVYNEQLQGHEELLSFIRKGEVNRALAAEAVAKARVEIAARGLNLTVIQDYYAIISAQRHLLNLQHSLAESRQFVEISQKQEKGGEAAHADVVRAQIDLAQRERDLKDAQVSIEKAKIALGVLIFPTFSADYGVFDDIEHPPLLPPVEEARAQAVATNPDLKAANSEVQQAGYEVSIAKYQYLPSLALDIFYGLDANQLAITSAEAQASGRSTLPSYLVAGRQNLGYSAQATLNVPVWNWGATRSKVRQAEMRRDQAQMDLMIARKTLDGNLASADAEARGAMAQIESLEGSVTLARESLRLTLLRYEAGEATALEVVDAQSTVNLARNALDDGLARYRIAFATLQTLTGNL